MHSDEEDVVFNMELHVRTASFHMGWKLTIPKFQWARKGWEFQNGYYGIPWECHSLNNWMEPL